MPSRFASTKKPRVSNAYQRRFGYDLLLDAGTPHELAEFFPYGGCFVPANFGLRPNARDEKLVARAETDKLMLVSHDADMEQSVRTHQAGKKLHKCLSGLVRLPSGIEKQTARLSDVRSAKAKLIYEGVQLFWHDIWLYNLYVDLGTRDWPVVSELCECGAEQFARDLRSRRVVL